VRLTLRRRLRDASLVGARRAVSGLVLVPVLLLGALWAGRPRFLGALSFAALGERQERERESQG